MYVLSETVSKMWIWSILVINTIVWCTEATLCSLKNKKIICNKVTHDDVYSNMTLAVDSNDVLDLSITDTNISSIDRNMFENYKNLHTLSMEKINITTIDHGTFQDLNKLRNLYLSGNLMKTFSFDVFSKNNALYCLDLSNNNLSTLEFFNGSYFNSLTLLNVSNNNLEYLPVEMLKKLTENNKLYLLIDNNPWNCSRPEWSGFMNENLTAAFCADIDTLNIEAEEDVLAKPLIQNLDVNGDIPGKEDRSAKTEDEEQEQRQCAYVIRCFSYCTLWFLGGIWIGIILGNMCKIKSLMCPAASKTSQEKDTQYNKYDIQ